jgi:ubiquinone/menaquinone biosynthesis C-methylase UbiE
MAAESRRASVVRNLDDQRGSASRKQVRAYWDAHPVGSERVPYQVGSPKWVETLYEKWKAGIDDHRLKFLESCRGKRVLEVGSGIGVDARYLIENGIDYQGLDYSFQSLQLSRKMVEAGNLSGRWVNGDATALPFAAEEFDLVYSIGVLHHVPDMEKACRELMRVVKRGGTVRVMLYNRHSYHYAVMIYVVLPLIWLMTRLPIPSAIASHLPEKFREMYLIAKHQGFDQRRLLNSSTDTSHPGEGHFNPLSRFVTEREVRALFDQLEDFRFFRMTLSYFPIPLLRRFVEKYFGFHLTFSATKRSDARD